MQIFMAVWKTFYRQKANLFFTVFFPSILVFILGTLLEQWNTAEQRIPEIKIAYVAEEDDPAFLTFLKETERQGLLETERVQEKEAALEKIDGTYAAVLCRETGGELVLYQGADSVANRTLQMLLEGYSSMERAAALSLSQGVVPKEAPADFVTGERLGVERSMIDYYAVSCLVMILFMGGCIGGANAIYDWKKDGVFLRTAVSPAEKTKVFCMAVLGHFPMVFVEEAAVMACSALLFGARYGEGVLENLALLLFFFVVGITLTAFGMAAGLLLRCQPVAVMMPLSWTVLFFSGSFAQLKIDGITQLMPAWYIQEAAFDLTLFGNYTRALSVGGICLVCFVALTAFGAALFCRKRNI